LHPAQRQTRRSHTPEPNFGEARRLTAPAGFADDELGGDKLRWSVKASFDFSDYAA
jgi:5-methylcytosine-specific restriction protein B